MQPYNLRTIEVVNSSSSKFNNRYKRYQSFLSKSCGSFTVPFTAQVVVLLLGAVTPVKAVGQQRSLGTYLVPRKAWDIFRPLDPVTRKNC